MKTINPTSINWDKFFAGKKPWDHQRATILENCKRDHYALFFEQGCGKTFTAINIARLNFIKENRFLKTLVIGPIAVTTNWEREFVAFGGEKYKDQVLVLVDDSKRRIKKLKNFQGNIIVTNKEAAAMAPSQKQLKSKNFDPGDYFWMQIMTWGVEQIIIDESHFFKDSQTIRTKWMIKLADLPSVKYKYILTGTALANKVWDIWAQYRILNHEIFGKSFTEFRKMYFQDNNAGMPKQKYFPDWQPILSLFPELNAKIYGCAKRVLKEECLDLPPLLKQRVVVPLSKEQQKIYQDMEKSFVSFLGDSICTAELAMTKALRLQQFLSGIFKDNEGNVQRIANHRTKVLEEVLEPILSHGHKVIVWSIFKESYEDIKAVFERLGVKAVMLTGLQDQKEKVANMDAFQNDPEVKAIIANQAAGGTGVNLTAASYAIYYSRGFSLTDDLQSEARNHRGGSEIHEKITRIDLVAPGTMDEYVLDVLHEKKHLAEMILSYKNNACKSESMTI